MNGDPNHAVVEDVAGITEGRVRPRARIATAAGRANVSPPVGPDM